MKRSLVFIFCLVGLMSTSMATESSEHYEQLFAEGNAAYKAGAYDSAKSIYSEILSSGMESAELYYNLGNTYFKLGSIPSSILYYERAHDLSPWDADIQHNLATAKSFTADKMEVVKPIFFKRWVSQTTSLLSADLWGWIVILGLILASIAFCIFWLSQGVGIRQSSLIASIVFMVFSVVSASFGYLSLAELETKEAIVFSPTVNVKSEPVPASTVLFVVHEGLKLEVLSEENDWVRVKFVDGNSGWIPAQSIEII